MPRDEIAKSSAILIASGGRFKVYHNVDEVPPELRRKLMESTSGADAATIVIADRRGRERLVKALRSLPRDARRHFLGLVTSGQPAPPLAPRRPFMWWRHILAVGLSLGIGFLVWVLLSSGWRK